VIVPSAVVSADLVAAGLDASDAEERRQATLLIAQLFLHDALPLLVRALGDSDWRVRKEATSASRAFVPAPKLIQAMIALFEPGENVGLRNAAVEVLGGCGSAATAPLADALSRLDADGRKLAVQALGATRDPRALVALARALDDPDSNVCHGAVEAIARLGPLAPAEVQKLLLQSLDARDSFCQLAALEGLNALGTVVPWDKLEPLFDHPALRFAALTAASLADDPRAPSTLVRIMRTARGNAFLLAAAALAQLTEGPLLPNVALALEAEGPALGERLVQLATSDRVEPLHHRASALLLAAITAASGVVEAAAFALEDELLSEAADRALRLLGPKVLPDLVERITPPAGAKKFSSDVRAALIDAAAAVAFAPGAQESLGDLVDALRAAALEDDRRVTASALCALSRLGDERDIELTARFVGSSFKPTARTAEVALSILSRRFPIAARRFVDALAERVVQGSAGVACTAIIVIGALAALPGASQQTFPASDKQLLTRCAASEEPRTRSTAIETLAVVVGESELQFFTLALADDAREVQIAAARALGVVGHAACFRDPDDGETAFPSLQSVIDIVTRSMDVELVATTIRMVSEDLDLKVGEAQSQRAASTILSVMAPLARETDSTIAIAAVETIGRLPFGTEGRQNALAAALGHVDEAVVKAAMLKLETSGSAGTEILQCLDHDSYEVRSLAAEIMAGSDNPALRGRLAERTSVELDLNMRDTLEGALSSIRWRGERSAGTS
jgi:HEAT repeat protein